MVAFPTGVRKERKAPIADEAREQILKELEERIKSMVKELLEDLMQEERKIYLEKHPTKANGYYTRDLLTLAGPLGDLRVPVCERVTSTQKILPNLRRTSLERSLAIIALYAARPGPSPAS